MRSCFLPKELIAGMTHGEGSGWTLRSLHTVPLHTVSEGHEMSSGLGIPVRNQSRMDSSISSTQSFICPNAPGLSLIISSHASLSSVPPVPPKAFCKSWAQAGYHLCLLTVYLDHLSSLLRHKNAELLKADLGTSKNHAKGPEPTSDTT